MQHATKQPCPASQQEEGGSEGWPSTRTFSISSVQLNHPAGSTLKPIKPHSPAALVFKIIAATASHPRNESFYSDHAHATVMLAVPV